MKISAALRRKIGNELHPLTKVFHDYIPLDKVFEILEKYGMIILQEDNTKWDGFLCGRDEHTTFTLGDISTRNELGEYKPIKNCLYFSWYKREVTNRYEINMYLC